MSYANTLSLFEGLCILAALSLLVGGLVRGALWLRRRRRPAGPEAPPEEEPMVSLVLLQARPRELYAEWFRQTAEKIFGVPLALNDEQDRPENFVVGDGEPLYLIHCHECFFLVNNVPEPYVEDPQAFLADPDGYLAGFPELRVRNAIKHHRSWTSVDLVHRAEGVSLAQAYRWMGRLIASLADENSLAVASRQNDQINVWNERIERRLLAGDDPLQVVRELQHAPVLPVPEDDRPMRQAVAEARRRWPEFVRAFEQRSRSDLFLVKAPFGSPDWHSVEYMWTEVTAIENGVVYGLLSNEPVDLTHLHAGDRVRVHVGAVNDWVYHTGGRSVGAFTIKALPGWRGPGPRRPSTE